MELSLYLTLSVGIFLAPASYVCVMDDRARMLTTGVIQGMLHQVRWREDGEPVFDVLSHDFPFPVVGFQQSVR